MCCPNPEEAGWSRCESAALRDADPEIHAAVLAEDRRQQEHLELIASENHCCAAVMEATGSVLTDKYAEGYAGRRYYGGCVHVDTVERLAIDRAKELFGAEHANVQPHAGSQANMGVFMAMLKPGDTVLGMSLAAGGHLTHGHGKNFSGQLYEFVSYGVDDDGVLDYDEMEMLAKRHNPAMIVAGASAYSRTIDFRRFRAVADEVDALLMVDMAHIAGLVAAGVHPSPVPYADFVTSTTHKTLRGPRGGFILCKKEHAKRVDSAVFPGIQGGPMMHAIAGKAVAFQLAMRPEFRDYQKQVVANAAAMATEMADAGFEIVSGGTDNHLFLLSLIGRPMNGREASRMLGRAHITVNHNAVPNDPLPPMKTSGIRIGTPATTTRGLKEDDARRVARLIAKVLDADGTDEVIAEVRQEVRDICKRFPIPH